jgi:prepilin peptidase CpaA
MSGKTDLFAYAVTAICALAALTDLWKGRIYNWLTLPALVLGLAYATYAGGWLGLGESLVAAVLGMFLLGWMFWLGVMGGGDVKLLMALGAWGGLRYVCEVALLSVFLGGALAVAILVGKGRFRSFARRFYAFLLPLFVKELEYTSPKIDRQLTMPYGIPIAVAGAWIAWGGNPLERLGLGLWH